MNLWNISCLNAKLYSEDRKVMFEDIKDVLQSSKDSRYVKISVGLLLGQGWESCITKSQNILIKQSVWPNFILGDHCKLNKSYQNLLLDTY